MAPRTQVNSATLILGITGSGKSSLARTLADYLWETFRKVLYYYNCDGGGFPAKVQEGIALGIIKGFRMRTRDPGDLGLAFETCYRAAQGWWPRRINPATCEVEPGVPMVPPIAKKWEQYCAAGHLVKRVAAQSLLTPQPCPTCKVMVTQQTMQVKEVLIESKGFEDRGGVFFDGLTSMLSWEMMELGQRAGKLELKGEEAAIGGKVISGSLSFGGVTRSHVGFAQTRGEELAHLALGIPNLLVPPVFTALSMEATDDAALSVVGPKIAGRAKTDEAGQWFGNCWETAIIPALEGTGTQRILYLTEFIDGQGRRHLLKHRAAPGTMPDYLIDPPNDQAPFTEFNLGKAFRMLDEALQSGIDASKLIYPDAPGLPEGMVEFGDGNVTETQPATTAPAAPTPAAPAVQPPGPTQGPQHGPPQAPPTAPPVATSRGRKRTTAPPPSTVQTAPPATAPPAPVAAEAAPPGASTTSATPAAAGVAEQTVVASAEPSPQTTRPDAPAPSVAPDPAPTSPAPVSPRPASTQARPVMAPPPGRRPVTAAPAIPSGAVNSPPALPSAGGAGPGVAAQAPQTQTPVAQAPPLAAPRPVASAPRPPAAAPRPPTAPKVN